MSGIFLCLVPLNIFSNCVSVFFAGITFAGVCLTVFGLVPMPPFSNSHVVFTMLPSECCFGIVRCRHCLVLTILLVVTANILSNPLGLLDDLVFNVVGLVASLPFVLF